MKITFWSIQPNRKTNNGFIQLNSMEIEQGNNKKQEEEKMRENKQVIFMWFSWKYSSSVKNQVLFIEFLSEVFFGKLKMI